MRKLTTIAAAVTIGAGALAVTLPASAAVNGPRAAYRCVLCGETYPRPERLNSRNECAECVDAAEGSWGF